MHKGQIEVNDQRDQITDKGNYFKKWQAKCGLALKIARKLIINQIIISIS